MNDQLNARAIALLIQIESSRVRAEVAMWIFVAIAIIAPMDTPKGLRLVALAFSIMFCLFERSFGKQSKNVSKLLDPTP